MDGLIQLIAAPLGFLMRLCYGFIGSYGLTIILFTLCTKLILFPVSLLVQKNSIKMVKMEPQLHALRLKYVDDKDAYLDAQIALYKQEKYRPMAGTVPLLIQIPIIFGLIDVIYKPMQYILRLPQSLVELFCGEAERLFGGPLGSAPQLAAMRMMTTGGQADAFLALGGEDVARAVAAVQGMDMSFLGLSLADTPAIAQFSPLWVVPLLAGLSAWALCWFQNRVNVLQIEQNKLSQIGMTVFLIAFSTFFAFLVPAGVGLYWIAGNLFAIPFLYILNWIMDPKQYIDYERMEAVKRYNAESEARKKANAKRARADYKRFFAKGNQAEMRVMIFSEQSGFYKYFKSMIEALLQKSDLTIHYVTGDPLDAVFAMDNPRIVPYYADEQRLIPLMMKVESDIVVMTVPDLEKYHIKRSRVRDDVEYIYIDHGGTSLNLTYRAGALDHFDTILAVNRSQVNEVRQIEALRHTKKKNIVECGYGQIDDMIAQYAAMEKRENEKPTILIAPSWQEDNVLESCLEPLLDGLLGRGWRVVVRPHPQYVRRFPAETAAIKACCEARGDADLTMETDFSSNVTIYTADLVITDWSAIGYEFIFATEKPALFVNTKIKAVNPEWEQIEEVPFEIEARNRLGRAVEKAELARLGDIVTELFDGREAYAARIREAKRDFLFNVGHSGEVAADYILYRLRQRGRISA